MNPTHKKMLHLPFSTNTCCFWPFLDVIHRTQSYIIHTPHKNRDLYQLRPTTEIMMDVVPNWQPNFEPHPLGYRFLGLFDLSNQPKDTNSKSSLHRRAWPPACSPWGEVHMCSMFQVTNAAWYGYIQAKKRFKCFTILDLPSNNAFQSPNPPQV